jgi:hypothetical protein
MASRHFNSEEGLCHVCEQHHNDGRGAAGVQTALIEEAPQTYFRPPCVGASGWVDVRTVTWV